MSDQHGRDPFTDLAQPIEPQQPRPTFARRLRAQLATALGLDEPTPDQQTSALDRTIPLPERKPTMTTTTSAPATSTPIATAVTPYLAVAGAADALAWYTDAFGATETFRVVGDDGRLGHAEFTIGNARFMLSDEYPEIGVLGPASLGGAGISLHLQVADVDTAFARAVGAGATSLGEPADQPHGARQGSLTDPFGHRWMLSQDIEQLDLSTYAERAEGSGFRVQHGPRAGMTYDDGIWGVMTYADVDAGIRFVTEVLGFEELVSVRSPDGRMVHSEYRWPEGGIVQLAGAEAGNPFLVEPGKNSGLYVVTQDPQAVWERCQAAGVEVIRPPEEPHYDPGGLGFSIRDPEGNAWSFGTYAGGATE